jgi:peptidase M28-like protein
MLTRAQRVAGLTVAVWAGALLILAWAFEAPRPMPTLTLARVDARFDGGSALEFTRVLAEQFPDRVTGTEAARLSACYLREAFNKFGYQVETQPFTMWRGGVRVEGQNVIATLSGEVPEALAVLAHYDGQLTSHQAAEDNASGVGVLLELARVLAVGRHHRELILVATDAEEWGMIGARRLAPLLLARHTRAAISIDYLHQGAVPALAIDCSGQFGGYTPLWMRELVIQAGQAQGAKVFGPTADWEWVERALEISAQDHGPLLHAGLPAFNISTLAEDAAGARSRYHTQGDVFRNFEPGTFRMLGATVEQALASLDASPLDFAGGMDDFRISGERYLPGRDVWMIQLAGFLPFWWAGALAARNIAARGAARFGKLIVRPLIYLVPPLLAVALLKLLAHTNMLSRYELYPATPKDPFLYRIPVGVVALVVAAFVAGYFLTRWLRRGLIGPEGPFGEAKGALCLWAGFLVLASFLINPYAAWLFLGVFAYSFLPLLPPRTVLGRGVNAALLLAGAAPFAMIMIFYGREIYLGWRILWYLILQAAYGVWSPGAVVSFLVAVVLWVRAWRATVFAPYAGSTNRTPGSGHQPA